MMDWTTPYFADKYTIGPIFAWGSTREPPATMEQWSLNLILTVVLSIVISVLVVAGFIALCCCCMIKRNRAKSAQATDGEIVYVDSAGQQVVRTPVTRQRVEIFRAKKKKKKQQPVASTTPLERAQVNVQNNFNASGQYDVSISNISQQAIVSTTALQPAPQPAVPAPLPAPNPTPRPGLGTTVLTVDNEPVTPTPTPTAAPAQPQRGPAVYNVPVAALGNHGYTIQEAAFDIPQPTPAPIFMARHHHHSSTHSQPPLSVAAQTQPSPAAQPYTAPPLPVPQSLPPPPPGQTQQYFAPPQPVPIPQGLPQQAALPYSPPSLSFPSYNAEFSFSGTLPSVYPVATQAPPAASTYGEGQGYAVSLPNISVGGGSVNMGYTAHQ